MLKKKARKRQEKINKRLFTSLETRNCTAERDLDDRNQVQAATCPKAGDIWMKNFSLEHCYCIEFSTICNTKLSQIFFGCKILGWTHLYWASLAKPEDIKFVPGERHVDFCPLLEVNPEALTHWQQIGNAIGDRKIPPCTHTMVMPLILCFCDIWTVSPVKLLPSYRNGNSGGILGLKHFCKCSEDFKIMGAE